MSLAIRRCVPVGSWWSKGMKVHFCEQSKLEDVLFSVGAQYEVLVVQLWQEALESKNLSAARKSSEHPCRKSTWYEMSARCARKVRRGEKQRNGRRLVEKRKRHGGRRSFQVRNSSARYIHNKCECSNPDIALCAAAEKNQNKKG